jgi:hypothetical protein
MAEQVKPNQDSALSKKQQVAQMAELKKNEKTGKMEYFVSFKDEKGDVQNKAFSELGKSQESLKAFLDKQKEMEGKSMQDIAVDQLGYAESSLKELEALNKGFATLSAGSRGGDELLKTISNNTKDNFGKLTKEYEPTEMRKNFEMFDKGASEFSKTIESVIKGDFVGAVNSFKGFTGDLKMVTDKLIASPLKEAGTENIENIVKALSGTLGLENVDEVVSSVSSLVDVFKKAIGLDDFIAVNGQLGKFNQNDIVLGGTGFFPNKSPESVEDVKKLVSETVSNSTNTNNTNSTVSGDMTLTLKIDAPSITQQMAEAIKTQIEKNPELIINTIKNRMDLTLPTGVKKV